MLPSDLKMGDVFLHLTDGNNFCLNVPQKYNSEYFSQWIVWVESLGSCDWFFSKTFLDTDIELI